MDRTIRIETERLTLVPLGMNFLMSTHAYSSDMEFTKYMMFLPNYTIEETADFLRECDAQWAKKQPMFYEFAVLCGEKHIGAVSVYHDENDFDTGELGWILHKDYHRKGYAYEAAKALIEFSAQTLGMDRLIAHCDTENTASYSLMEKLGMRRVDEYGGRKNKCSDEERREYLYEIIL